MKNERIVLEITRYYDVETIERNYQKISDKGNKNDGGAVYGYVDYPTVSHKEDILLTQEIEKENIRAIIAAANGFKEKE